MKTGGNLVLLPCQTNSIFDERSHPRLMKGSEFFFLADLAGKRSILGDSLVQLVHHRVEVGFDFEYLFEVLIKSIEKMIESVITDHDDFGLEFDGFWF